jgi:predicted 3-demethylubiquinone-9 3-methyltransferase (glyoxalase superfamily)
VDCEDQAEVDRYWEALVKAGSTPTQCGWITDPFGLTWQIVPRRFMELIDDPNPTKVQAVMAAMLTMVKLDVAALEKAYEEA